MKIIAVVMHIVVICLLSYVFFKAGAPDKLIDGLWRVLFIALPLINLYILFKIKKVKKKPR